MRSLLQVSAALFSLTIACHAQQSKICDAVLSPGVFNIGETRNSEIFASKFKNDFCSTKWQNQSDVQNRGSSFGLSGSYLDATLGINSADYANSAVLDARYDQFCKKTVQDIAYSSSFFNKYSSSDFAVSQWSLCVRDNAEGHYALVVPDQGLTGALVTLTIKSTATVAPLQITSVQPGGSYDVSCYFGSQLATQVSFPAGQTQVALSCFKRADVTATFTINSNWGTFNPIYIPGYSKTISSIQTDISEGRANLEKSLKDLSSRLDIVSAKALKQCRVCFQETQGSDQCQGNRNSCSDWASVDQPSPNWTQPYIDDTDNRAGACTYQWRLQCQ